MEYLFAVFVLIGVWALTTMLTGIFGIFIPIIYTFLGFIFGAESIILGAGWFVGSILTIISTNMYIKSQSAMSRAPVQGRSASIGFIVAFAVTIFLKHILNYDITEISYLIVFGVIFAFWVISNSILRNRQVKSVENLLESVVKYKILAKYENAPKWATYLYFKDGFENWNQTIPGSYLAKNPENDLTFVHSTKEEALSYAQRNFKNAKFIDE
jgi:hypothetical protein